MLSVLSQLVDSVSISDLKVWSSRCCQNGIKTIDHIGVTCSHISTFNSSIAPRVTLFVYPKGYTIGYCSNGDLSISSSNAR